MAGASDRTHTPSGFFVFRTPLLPFDEFLAWTRMGRRVTTVQGGDDDVYAEAVEQDLAALRERLAVLVRRPEIRQALFVASTSLDDAVTQWLQHPDNERFRDIALPVARYFQRMVSRCTPFGLFAACSIGTIANETSLSLAPRASYRTHTRLDHDYLFALSEALGREERIRGVLLYRPNTSLYRAGGRLRYAETRLAGRTRSYHLVGIVPTDYLDAVLERARHGATRAELAQTLIDLDPGVAEEAEAFVNDLIDAQILVSTLTPPVTGAEPTQFLIELATGHDPLAGARAALEAVRGDIAEMDANGLGHAADAYRAVAQRLEPLPAKVDLARLFQVDTFKPASATLGPAVLEEVFRAIELATKLARQPKDDRLASFRKAFTERYEDAEVPLLDVLDDEIGIGFERSDAAHHVPLLDGLPFPAPASPRAGGMDDMEGWLLRRVLEIGPEAEELVLDDNDVRQLSAREPIDLPDAFSVTCAVRARSIEALRKGDFQLSFRSIWGPSGANLLGRFCHMDPALEAAVRRHLREEEACRPDAVFAEIVHLPEGRLGNIISRPVLRDYELAYLGRSGADQDKVLHADDLLVSVSGKRVTLRSRRLGREVIPRLTNAHSHSHRRNLNVYRFLAALMAQDVVTWWGWQWGFLEQAPRLPRVRYGKLLLARASWLLKRTDFAPPKASAASRVRTLREWRGRMKAPRFLALTDLDHELLVDFDNALSLEAFAQAVKNRPACRLAELVSDPELLLASGPEGRFFHEIVIPFTRGAPRRRAPEPRRPVQGQRRFLPGDAWLFAKLYTGTATLDEVLVEAVAPLVRDVVAEGRCDRWFFIRYADPDSHLRLRFRGPRDYLRSSVLEALHERVQPSVRDGRVHSMQLDTYHREIERYGGDAGIELAEELFRIDSDAVLVVMAVLQELDAHGEARWRLTLRGVDQLLDDLGFDLDAKQSIVRRLRSNFGSEFKVDDSNLRHQLGSRFRALRKTVESTLDDELRADDALAPAFAALASRSERLTPVREALRAAAASGTLTRSLEELAGNFVHMHANRMFHASTRKQEVVVYDFLARVYESRLARRKSGQRG